MEKVISEVKDTESDAIPMDDDQLENEPDGSDEHNDLAMEADHTQPGEEEASDDANESSLNDTTKVPRPSRSARASVTKQTPKTPERKGQKRKSTVSTTASNQKSKLPKYEAVPVSLTTKTIPIKSDNKYKALDRAKRISIPSKEGTFEVGDLIWAKMVGFPWWPCLVSVDPDSGLYSKISGLLFFVLISF